MTKLAKHVKLYTKTQKLPIKVHCVKELIHESCFEHLVFREQELRLLVDFDFPPHPSKVALSFITKHRVQNSALGSRYL